jgi:hypothetical protein
LVGRIENTSRALSAGDQNGLDKGFAPGSPLSEEPGNPVTVDGLLNLLQKYGPLWLIADDSIDNNKLVHARIVTALKGDGTADGTEVTCIDTAKGDFAPPESFKTFLQKITSADAEEVDLGMLHY